MADYERMLQQHQAVLADVDRLELLIGSPPEQLSDERVRELTINDAASLRDDLARHFAYEEEGGYLSVVLDARPGLERKVAALQAEHREILRRLAEAVGASRDAPIDRIRAEIGVALAQLRAHEAAETELVHTTVNQDVGTPD